MKILVIGGTRFVGRAFVESAIANGHTITLFNRGLSNPDLFPELEIIHGDRDGDLDKLGEHTWDAVLDPCGFFPRIVAMSAQYLADKVKHYVFVSSISAYAESPVINRDEDAAVATLDNPTIEEITGETYGGLKVLCEHAVEEALPGRALIVRPGLIVGPHDASNRFTYWPVRIQKGGDVLVPSRPDYPGQFIDVRDLGDFMLKLIEDEKTGIYNATGRVIPLGEVFETCKKVSGSNANFIWVDDETLKAHEVGPWMEMPLWLPGPNEEALMQCSIERALRDGLTLRPLEETIRATLDWYAEINGDEKEWPAGMKPEREQAILQAVQA